MDPRTITTLMKEDLGTGKPVIIQWPLLIPNAQEMRKERCFKVIKKAS
jgi:hypothetical protein